MRTEKEIVKELERKAKVLRNVIKQFEECDNFADLEMIKEYKASLKTLNWVLK